LQISFQIERDRTHWRGKEVLKRWGMRYWQQRTGEMNMSLAGSHGGTGISIGVQQVN
jgi:hypothetical protein